jgi:hypothetical protein
VIFEYAGVTAGVTEQEIIKVKEWDGFASVIIDISADQDPHLYAPQDDVPTLLFVEYNQL